MQENAAPPRVGRDVLVAHERAVLERVKSVTSTCVASIVEGDRVAINWMFEFIYHSGKTHGSTKSRCRNGAATGFFASGSSTIRRSRSLMTAADSSVGAEAIDGWVCYLSASWPGLTRP